MALTDIKLAFISEMVDNRCMKWRYDRAQELLDEEGRTRRWLASKVGLTALTLRQYMVGNGKPGATALQLAALALGCSEEYLLGTSDERGPRHRASG